MNYYKWMVIFIISFSLVLQIDRYLDFIELKELHENQLSRTMMIETACRGRGGGWVDQQLNCD